MWVLPHCLLVQTAGVANIPRPGEGGKDRPARNFEWPNKKRGKQTINLRIETPNKFFSPGVLLISFLDPIYCRVKLHHRLVLFHFFGGCSGFSKKGHG